MKTRFIIAIIILFISTGLNAQRFNGGILVGINTSQIDGDSWAGYNKVGLLTGAFVNTEIAEDWEAQMEIKFAGKGAAPKAKSPDQRKIRLNYIDVPIIAGYKPINALKIEGGVSFNYLFSAEFYDAVWENMFDWYEQPNNFEMALTFGVNYTFFQNFDLNVRYNYSLFPVRTNYSGSSLGEGAWFNNVLSFALYFHIGRRE